MVPVNNHIKASKLSGGTDDNLPILNAKLFQEKWIFIGDLHRLVDEIKFLWPA